MDIKSKEIGRLGEKIAEDYLRKKGYEILGRNYSFKKFGEIDIIAKKKRKIFDILKGNKRENSIHFIEVKTLNNPPPSFLPEEKVDFKKKRKLIKTAESWLIKNKIPLNSKWQIDIISIFLENGKAKISHFKNAIPYF